jgi:hypothetical protein
VIYFCLIYSGKYEIIEINWFAVVYSKEVNVLHLPVSMTREICVHILCLWSNLNSNYSRIPEIQLKYICAAVNFTCLFETVRKLGPHIDIAILNCNATMGMLEKRC